MIGTPDELHARLALVRASLARSSEPLHFPLGLVFRPLAGTARLDAWAAHTARVLHGDTLSTAVLYVHIPFCARVCTYCLLSAVRTPGREAVSDYVSALRREISMVEPVVRGLTFRSLHIGGGTPTLLDETQLDEVFGDLARLPLAPGAQVGVEAHPGTATLKRLAVLRRHGVHRVSFGVESLTPTVLRNVNREDQTEARVAAAVATARELELGVNIDLLAGLPGETAESWEETVRKTVGLAPDSLSVNRFLGENSPLARYGYAPDEGENHRADEMLRRADEILRAESPPSFPPEPLGLPGFGTQYGWDRPTVDREYFQDDMIGPVSTLSLGHGALGHVHGQHFTVAAGEIRDYVASLARGEAPAMLAATVTERFEMAFFVADRASRGDLTARSFDRVFRQKIQEVFGDELGYLLRRGMLSRHDERIAKPQHPWFDATHLLAFLAGDAPTLAAEAKAIPEESPREGPVGTVVGRLDDVDGLISRIAAEGARELTVDVGDGLDGETATRLASVGARHGMVMAVRGDEHRALAQYGAIRGEMPLSMLWVRLAIRASQASRGAQRLAVIRAR